MKSNVPVIVVCNQNGLIGIMLRSDYDEASRSHWEKVRAGGRYYDGRKLAGEMGISLPVPREHVFVFRTGCAEHVKLASYAYIERVHFWVPFANTALKPHPEDELTNALERIQRGGQVPLRNVQAATNELVRGGFVEVLLKEEGRLAAATAFRSGDGTAFRLTDDSRSLTSDYLKGLEPHSGHTRRSLVMYGDDQTSHHVDKISELLTKYAGMVVRLTPQRHD